MLVFLTQGNFYFHADGTSNEDDTSKINYELIETMVLKPVEIIKKLNC